MTSSSWIPIIPSDSDLAVRAWRTVNDITEGVVNFLQGAPHDSKTSCYQDIPVLWAYLSAALKSDYWLERCAQALNDKILTANTNGHSLALFGGLSGLGWSIEHVMSLFPSVFEEEDAADPSEDIDQLLIKSLQEDRWSGRYDLVSGLVGIGTYWLERYPKGRAPQGIRLTIQRLAEQAVVKADGITWHSDAAHLPSWQRDVCPSGYYNLGVAHGIPGIIHFLAQTAQIGCVKDESERLLTGSVEWLLSNRRVGTVSWFTDWVAPGQDRDTRLTWCYGDLGILSVLMYVTRRIECVKWESIAAEFLTHCLDRPAETNRVGDAPLCHGAAGTAHMFNRLFQETTDARCRECALVWVEKTLEMRMDGRGIAGFPALRHPDPNGPAIWQPSSALLDGESGIALMLLSALLPLEPSWDRLLLLSSRF